MAVAIVLGASMSDVTLLAHHAPGAGRRAERHNVRRTLGWLTRGTQDKIVRARARIRNHAWSLIAATLTGFPWLAIP